MPYSPYNPIFLAITGAVVTSPGSVPADIGVFYLPITGTRYCLWSHTYWVVNGTGFGSNGGTYNFFSSSGGTGTQLQNSAASTSSLTTAMSIAADFTSSSTQSGTFISPIVVARQMTAADCTGILGIKLGFMPLP